MSLRSDLKSGSHRERGGKATHARRAGAINRFCDFVAARRQVGGAARCAGWQVKEYLDDMRARGLAPRTIQSERSALLVSFVGAGRRDIANSSEIAPEALGIAHASREGTHTAISSAEYDERAARIRDPGVRAALDLSREFGLRREEAVQAGDSLRDWKRALDQGKPVHVVYGTKGGRPRYTPPLDVERARSVIERAIAVAEHHGGHMHLVHGKGGDLKSSLMKFSSDARRAGFVGKLSPHAVRYSYTHTRVAQCEAAGDSHSNALAAVAQDLGHGDGRGRWVEHVYLR